MMNSSRLNAVSAALFSLAVAAPTMSYGATPREAVAYRDLDLSTDQGAKLLLRRIDRAAQRVCEEQMTGQHGIEPARRYLDCRNAATAEAVRAIGSDRLTRLVAAKAPSAVVSYADRH